MIMPPSLTSSMVDSNTKSLNPDSPTTSNASPSCLKWAESFDNLIRDSEGVSLFRKFLEQEGSTGSLDFWFACQGFKLNIDPSDHQKAQRLIRVIYKSFIHGDLNKRSMGISSETRRIISNYLHSSSTSSVVDMNIFDKAQDEAEDLLRTSLYPGFLHSDLYVQWIQKLTSHSCSGKDSPDSIEDSSSPSLSEKLMGGLQTLDEDLEFQMDEEKKSAALTSANLLVTCQHRIHQSYKKRSSQEKIPLSKYEADPLMNPYHVSYAPVSTRDSELQSLSSSQFTDETRSKTTDSSRCDSCKPLSNGKWSSHNNNYSCHLTAIPYNPESAHSLQPVIPRTHFDNQTVKRNLAERDPEAFAFELSSRLEHVARDQTHQTKIETLNKQHQVVESPASNSILSSLASRLGTCDPHEADAQSILEEHCSRIWANSTQGSPPSDAAETGSPQQHYSHHHHHHVHHYKHKSSSRRSRHHAGSTADSASICTVGVDSGVSLPTVISSNSSNSASVIQSNKSSSQNNSSTQFYQQTQQTSDKVLAWIYDNRESQSQRTTHKTSGKPSRSSHLTSSNCAPSPRSKSLCREEQSGCSAESGLVIGYYLSGDNVPFRCQWPQSTINLGQFKNLISRKCNYRFFFKQVCHDFESEVVYEELSNEDSIVPLYQGKVVAKVMRID